MSSSYPGALPPPPGVTADINNPQDVLRTCHYVTQALTLVFVSVFVGLRLYAKRKVLVNSLTTDDFAIYSAYLFMVGYCICAFFMGIHGGGLNQWDVAVTQIEPFFKACYAATLFYAPMAFTVKLALLVMIVRVFGTVHRKTLIGMYILIAVIVAYYVSGFFIKIFICWPIPAYWHGESDKCMNQSAIITADAIISVISDLVILFLPTPLTWSLQLPKRKRLRVAGLLCAGGIATAFSIYRLALIITDKASHNQTIVFTKVVLSGNAEVGIGLICACLPAINAIFVRANKSGYLGQPSHNSEARGQIMLTRSYQVDRTQDGKKVLEIEMEAGGDEDGLVSGGQEPSMLHRQPSNTNSQPPSLRSDETYC
ncbi:GPCR, PTH11-type [Purpureocillium lilacinum]|uniref:GPCR, PTH11-type n=2 Tax=Purpureocillium lilacinum TaxID=33203 RepID=A0A179GGY3_PURLI|nr:GPCR, PTH11-type [Purpureocillium lilacinum]KAK4093719.1 hypothetical protein Purlil1_2053 [Purpureocillium lilacinum]OAQ77114.1 GPCR, PTH11-type [Purpureocillium lilacinum]OAQ85876.1 GPCR, PTH11-type [Purpureocillium lilacinum]PWI65962.1 hypothetical protein PCL_05440 [Purpureocillium lilacinum]GJN85604.1 hypothetical protein PLIIFM63780_009172 [Purpureocillium lilacinum]